MGIRERMVLCWEWFRNIGPQHYFFLSVQFVIGITCLVLWVHLPPPGWSVAVLAFAAAAMSIQVEMRGWQRALWMLLLGGLLVVELRSISKDRTEAQNQFIETQKQHNKEFAQTATDLQTAIGGIKQTLEASDQTLQQTRAHSAIRFDRFEWVNAPSQIRSGEEYGFNYYYVNAGTATATDVDILPEIYIANADDAKAQLELAKRFERDWKKGGGHKDGGHLSQKTLLVPSDLRFGSVKQTFTTQEIASSKWTVYLLVRFDYTDETGHWRTDACSAFQRDSQANVAINVSHPCPIFQKYRYPVSN